MIYIYGLCEPGSGEIRYVGQSTNPRRRLGNHCSLSAADGVREWLDDLGTEPLLVILAEEATQAAADEAERRFIGQLRRPRLLNRHHGAALDLPRRERAQRERAPLSRGALALRDVMVARYLSQNAVAREVGLAAGVVCRLLTGKRRPGLAVALKLEAAYGVAATAWQEAA